MKKAVVTTGAAAVLAVIGFGAGGSIESASGQVPQITNVTVPPPYSCSAVGVNHFSAGQLDTASISGSGSVVCRYSSEVVSVTVTTTVSQPPVGAPSVSGNRTNFNASQAGVSSTRGGYNYAPGLTTVTTAIKGGGTWQGQARSAQTTVTQTY